MIEIPWSWVLLVAGAFVTGASCVAILVVKRQLEILAAIVGVASFAFSIYTLASLARTYERVDVAVYAVAFMLAAAAGGWALAASVLERAGERAESVTLAPQTIEAEREGVAVVLFADIERAEYDPIDTARALSDLTDDDLVSVSLATLPFLFFAQKARYRALGGRSPAHAELRTVADRLSHSLKGVERIEYATCEGESSLASRVQSLALAGFKTIVAAELAVGDSRDLADAKRQTDALRLQDHGVRVAFTSPIGASERIVSMLVQRILRVTEDAAGTGVILLGQGQPETLARLHPDFDIQENALLSRVRMQLTDAGVAEDNVHIAWAEWRAPDLINTVRHLAALGCRRIVVVPGTFPLDTITTRLDTELAVHQARIDSSVTVVTLPAWSDDPRLVAELAERVDGEL
ncbi:MAG TPA: ferrochelatase [Coriobacteriia bacterium]|nr:ferrochelatase [Coriobacteriia bacterium]